MKDDGKDHFEFVYHDLSANDMNEDKLEYTKCGRIGLNIWVSLFHINILQRAYQCAQFRMKRHLGVT